MRALLSKSNSLGRPETATEQARRASKTAEAETKEAENKPKRAALRLEISAAEAFPWPGLVVRAAARLKNSLVRLRNLKLKGNGFTYQDLYVTADPLETLLIRSILSLPTDDGVVFRAEGRRFAPTLSLLRQVAKAELNYFKYRESERVSGCNFLRHPPEPILSLNPLTGAQNLQIRATPSYRDSSSGQPLGYPLFRDNNWLAFPNAISPVCEPLSSDVLQKVFDRGSCQFKQKEAWEIVRASLKAGNEIAVKLPAELADAATAEAPKPFISIESSGRARRSSSKLCATLRFSPPGGASSDKKTSNIVSAEDIIQAAERGEEVLRLGDQWCRVDKLTVEQARKTLGQMTSANGTPDTFHATNEQIPELLNWAQNQQIDSDSPWNVYVGQAVQGAHRVQDETVEMRFHLDTKEEDGESWFTMTATFDANGKALTEDDVESLISQRKKWLKKGDKWLKFNPEAYYKYQREATQLGLKRFGKNGFKFTAESREKVSDLFSLAGTIEHSDSYRSFVENLRSFQEVELSEVSESLILNLRPYQQHGYSWMRFLSKYGLNGILADDMGLGKTAQTIALLASIKDEIGSQPSLIVCPTSLIDNWRAEIKKFAPSLTTLRYNGSPKRRDRLRQELHQFDVTLATYATVRNDADLLKNFRWNYIILDEAHAIKNPSTAVSKAIKTIPAKHRLALTGTPVQNRLQELWSIFDFLMPNFLGRHASFFRQYEEPITRSQSPDVTKEDKRQGQQAGELLRERIKPFILRRLKTEVAKELPAKIIQDVPCNLTSDQVSLYQKFSKSDEAREVVDNIEDKGSSQLAILTALGSLRKVCNHPDLVHLSSEVSSKKRIVPLAGYEERSGKLIALAELWDQCREGGHRSLLFCQQTSMLDIIEHFLKERGRKYLRLDGSTPPNQRQGLVNQYNADPEIETFLISTRAGGSGLNLTGADTVIFYDHDWNPANDRQAQDRAYRIGQKKVVNVYRLVSRGTLEEKILERQQRKQDLAESIVTDDPTGIKNLTRNELLSLFEFQG